MGTADLVPGVSGGTIALVGGIYDDLIDAIAAFDREALSLLGSGRMSAFARHVRLGFLVPLVLGLGTAVVLLSGLLAGWLADPVSRSRLYAFFIGLVLASIVAVGRRIAWASGPAVLAAVGTAVGLGVALLTPAQTPATIPWAVIGGALGICAMILPGISGAFILLLVGQYDRAITAVDELDFATIAWFGLGAVVGLLVMVRLLRWALHHHHARTLALLVGFMVGTLPRLWPWNECIECARPEWYLPTAGEVAVAVGFVLVGALAVVAFERAATRTAR